MRSQVINNLRSHLCILSNWQRQNRNGEWQILPVVNSKQNKPILAFLQNEENIHLKQVWKVPENYAGLSTIDATIRLNLIWWVDICELWIDGHKVQEGDLFDQKCRILLTDRALPNHEFTLEIKLNSPKHDIGALQLSELIFEYPHQLCDGDRLATELEILQTYIPIFTKHQIDLEPLETATNRLIGLFALPELTTPKLTTNENFFAQLVTIREPLLQYGEFLKQRQIYMLGNSHIDVAWLWAIAGVSVAPGDLLEYTIYFLSSGNTNVTDVTICDLIPPQTTFVNNAYGNGLGMAFANSVTATPTSNLTNIADSDRGRFYPAGSTPNTTTPAPPVTVCNKPNTAIPMTIDDNKDGLVVVDVVKISDPLPNFLPFATGAGTPANSYGFVRFHVKVK